VLALQLTLPHPVRLVNRSEEPFFGLALILSGRRNGQESGAFRMPLPRSISIHSREYIGKIEEFCPSNKFVGQLWTAPHAAVARGGRLIPARSDRASFRTREVMNLPKSIGRADEPAKGFDQGLGAVPLFDRIGHQWRLWFIAKQRELVPHTFILGQATIVLQQGD